MEEFNVSMPLERQNTEFYTEEFHAFIWENERKKKLLHNWTFISTHQCPLLKIISKISKYGVNTEHFHEIQVLREKSRNTEPLTALGNRVTIYPSHTRI